MVSTSDIMTDDKKLHQDKNLRIIYGVTLTAVMGVASITPAFPKIMNALDITAQQIGWLIVLFTLPGVVLTPVLGIMADRYGRKRVLVPSLFLFGIAGAAGMFSRSFMLILILRFLQGVGAASLGSMNVTLIGDLYSGRQRTMAMGYNASVLSIGTATYPLIGGSLAMLGWYYPFLLPIFALPLGFVVLYSLDNPEVKSEQRIFDQFKNTVKTMLNRQVLVMFTSSVTLFLILYGACLTFIPVMMADSFDATSLEIGLTFTVMSLVTAITSSRLGALTARFDERTLFRFGFLFYCAALFLIPFMPSKWFMIIPMVIFGMGHGMNIPCIQTILSGIAPMEYRAAFMSINGMVLRLGQTLGPPVMTLFYTLWGIKAPFFAGSALGVFMFFFSMMMQREESCKV
jgi:MFS family permease